MRLNNTEVYLLANICNNSLIFSAFMLKFMFFDTPAI